MNQSIYFSSYSSLEINYENLKILLKNLSSTDNTLRSKTEEILFTLKFELKLYEILFYIFMNDNEEKYYKIHSIVLVKNLIRQEINSNKTKFRVSLNNPETNGIISPNIRKQ